MKKVILVILIIIITFATLSCNVQTEKQITNSESTAAVNNAPVGINYEGDKLGAELQAAKTVEEVKILMKTYVKNGDYETALRCANRMLEIDPNNKDTYYAQTELQILMLQVGFDKLNRTVSQGAKQLDDPAEYANFINGLLGQIDFTVKIPFIHDYA